MDKTRLLRAAELIRDQVDLLATLVPARAEQLHEQIHKAMSGHSRLQVYMDLGLFVADARNRISDWKADLRQELDAILNELGGDAGRLRGPVLKITMPGNLDEMIERSHKPFNAAMEKLTRMQGSKTTAEELADLRDRTIAARVNSFLEEQETSRARSAALPEKMDGILWGAKMWAMGQDQVDRLAGMIAIGSLTATRATMNQIDQSGLSVSDELRNATAVISNDLIDIANETLVPKGPGLRPLNHITLRDDLPEPG